MVLNGNCYLTFSPPSVFLRALDRFLRTSSQEATLGSIRRANAAGRRNAGNGQEKDDDTEEENISVDSLRVNMDVCTLI
ncbi:hypothetical protein DPMN_158149 [Dreissena polymorpha]|uniref:Uncharacterized protein n=1 Tax=Dreissena polymorpha TaxID=45954 RepID=A0A9D4ILQ7_DREPO|nr:hypothetical protein DPMN_158149 [Dreissena polymorpha]